MSKVFTSDKFIEKLKHVETLPTVYYSVSGGDWASWNGWSWNFDCVILIKALLWGWCENKTPYSHGGAVYLSNGVPDVDADTLITLCENVSNDFSNITPGELLYMGGHVGIYVGDRKVIECTAGWEGKVLYSEIGYDGKRTKNGVQIGYWQKHGKLPYIEYTNTPEPPTPSNKVNVYYRVKTRKDGWLPEVKNLEDYAGWDNHSIKGLAVKVDKGSVNYQVHVKNGGWLPIVSGYDINDYKNGWAGNDETIDCVKIYYNTPDNIRPYKRAKYKVNDYDWQYDFETSGGQDGYAGEMGVSAKEIRITIE